MNMNTTTTLAARAAANLQRVRDTRPLVHNITNQVTINFVANVLLAAGAAPVMAHAPNEVADMVALAKALVLNIGTLDDAQVAAMLHAGQAAARRGIPIVLDPVGAGATPLRTTAAQRILAETKVAVVRGNASEILALAGAAAQTRGVDAADSVEAAVTGGRELARATGAVVAITGPTDVIMDAQRVVRVTNGHPLMGCVTGTGCAATAVIGAFAAVDEDRLLATATALAYFGLAGEYAADGAPGPGTFAVRFTDALHELTPEEMEHGARLTEG